MAFLTITRRCKHCDDTRSELAALRQEVSDYRREVKESLLDYESLYDKVRVNLAKLAKRSEPAPAEPDNGPVPNLAYAHKLLLERKLRR